MDELLKKLLAAEVLTEETRQELEGAFKKQLDEAMNVARAEAQATVTAELNEQWINDREILIEALDSKVTEALAEELTELRTDIERFRDLEAEYAEKLIEAKSGLGDTMKKDIAQLIEKLDSFLEVRLTAELEELREDVAVVKKNEFGRKVFESFVAEFKKHYAGDDSLEGKLTESEQRLEDALTALENAEKKSAKLERTMKLEKVLAPLSGRSKEIMEAILKTVDTALLEDAYKTYVGRVLKETSDKGVVETSEKEDKVLAEGVKEEVSGVAKTGDNEEQLIEEATREKLEERAPSITDAERQRLRRLAGLA
jgi:CHASE3 domain sensor protein